MRNSKLLLFVCSFLFVANAVHASEAKPSVNVLTCSFTEPFIGVKYVAAVGQAMVEVYGDETQVFDVDFVGDIKGFQLVTADGQIILSGALNYDGSDGMSDYSYPFDAYYGPAERGVLRGGCYSPEYPRWIDDSITDPGV